MRAKLCACFSLCLAASGAQQIYEFSTFDVPGVKYTYARGINAAGQVCGYFQSADPGPTHGFLRDASGSFTIFDAPGAAMTSAFAINDHGQCAGQWSPDTIGNFQHAFIRNPDGTFVSFDAPGYDVTGAYGINNAGQMTINALKEPGPYVSFFRNADGTYSGIGGPGFLQGLNNNGIVVGSPAFEGLMNGETITFEVPGSTSGTTQAYGINSQNVIAGTYNLGFGYDQVTHGFLREPDGRFLLFDVPNAFATTPYGINDLGEVVGSFADATGFHGFIATPCPDQRFFRSPAVKVSLVPAGGCLTIPPTHVHR